MVRLPRQVRQAGFQRHIVLCVQVFFEISIAAASCAGWKARGHLTVAAVFVN